MALQIGRDSTEQLGIVFMDPRIVVIRSVGRVVVKYGVKMYNVKKKYDSPQRDLANKTQSENIDLVKLALLESANGLGIQVEPMHLRDP